MLGHTVSLAETRSTVRDALELLKGDPKPENVVEARNLLESLIDDLTYTGTITEVEQLNQRLVGGATV
ncbi:hypothetical protein [Alkalicoccobacillus porphyridii]|uniref:Uncharacterized protein n=1 Tax=Alkalicoccobacillus porphyridii TaxID=2597270 RepID=A0A554A0C7_9BACI|nr:hypothetical protein [Alkalicoccobacillus porphyridii]TSB47149.1 hypothetical protein FN960_09070 [Alkalicoccobacillus porphyridii]